MKPFKSFIRVVTSSALLMILVDSYGVEAQATIRRVPADYPTIQQAIDASVNGDTVLVSPGSYAENINFVGKAIRITSVGGPQITIIEGNHNGSVVNFISGEGLTSELSGFTLQNGATLGFGEGSGINVQNSSPTITGNKIINNSGIDGGGIRVAGTSSPVISDNSITNNNTSGFGGGIAALGSSPIIQRNFVANNLGFAGGGMGMLGSSAQILNNTIQDNQAQFGGGIELFGATGPNTIRANVISGNAAQFGGGIDMVNDSPALIVQNLIINNRANSGGGISWGNPPEGLINNTIADNDASDGSGVFAGFSIGALFLNNIVVAKAGQVAFSGFSPNSIPSVFKSNDVFSPQGPAYGGGCPDQTGLNGNISADPLFVNPITGDYHLRTGSPSIDSGDNSAPNLPSTDFDGNPRIQDGNGDSVAIVDMGAFEALPPSPPFDICIRDDSSGDIFKFNSTTGDYQFTNCSGSTLTGKGGLIKRGGIITLQDYSADRRVLARIDTSVNKGTASIQVFSQGTTFTITDRNTANNTCACAVT